MKYTRIEEEKWAKVIVLEKLKDAFFVEKNNEEIQLNEFIHLNGLDYKINHDIFVKTIEWLEAEGIIISSKYFMEMTLAESIPDVLKFSEEEISRSPDFSYKELDEANIFEYQLKIKDSQKIQSHIASLETLGISATSLRKEFGTITEELPSLDFKTVPSDSITFDENTGALKIGGYSFELPFGKKEYALCKYMFGQLLHTPISWDVLYEEISGNESKNATKDKKMVLDTIYALDRRISRKLKNPDSIIVMTDSSVKRRF